MKYLLLASGTFAAFLWSLAIGLVPNLRPVDIGPVLDHTLGFRSKRVNAFAATHVRRGKSTLTLFQVLTEMIDIRSFSNLWYWIALAVMWSAVSHRVLGVPYDMVTRARKYGAQSEQDLADLVRINVNRMLFVVQSAGVWLLGFACFVLSVLATLGFLLGVEIAQSVFLLMFPLSLVSLINLYFANRISHQNLSGEALYRAMSICRICIQILGMIFIFITAMWGMFQNLNIGPLG